MSKIRRLEEHRFVGARNDMVVYDTDNPAQALVIAERVETEDLINRRLVSTFGPDTLVEAVNRGFAPASK